MINHERNTMTNPRSRELGEDAPDIGVVPGTHAALPQVAGGARERHILDGRGAPLGMRHDVVQVKDAAICVEELEDSSVRDGRARGAEPAVLADATVAFGDSVTDGGWDVAGVSHATKDTVRVGGMGCKTGRSAAAGAALQPPVVALQNSVLSPGGLLDRLLPTEVIQVPVVAEWLEIVGVA